MTQKTGELLIPALFLILLALFSAGCPNSGENEDGDGGPDGDTTDGDQVPDGDVDGDAITEGDAAPQCPPGFHWDEESGSCRIGGACPPGFEWDPDPGKCVPEGSIIDGDGEDEMEIPPDTFQCSDLGLPVREFIQAENDDTLYATAADFTLPTTAGDWTFSEKWTGCESYLFIQDVPRQTGGWDEFLWGRDVEDLLDRLPENTQVFFMSVYSEKQRRQENLAIIRSGVAKALRDRTADEQARWFHRIHFITEQSKVLGGWLGDHMNSTRWGVGIDRFQRIRYIGSYADYERYDEGMQWFAPNLSMAANEAVYYNFEAKREAELEAENATVIPLFTGDVLSDGSWAGAKGFADVTFPDAAAMKDFDSMSLDLYLGCEGSGEYGACPAWDYIVHLYLCKIVETDGDADGDKDGDADGIEINTRGDTEPSYDCSTEFGRWITTYHREGRWIHDVSGLLPLVAEGGAQRFAFYTQQPYEVDLKIRLSSQDKAARPVSATYLFSGGGFDNDYNVKYEALTLAIPADALKVELATVITGHGMASPGNCAEFCNTTHHFSVNGTENILDFPVVGDNEGCMKQVADGAVPNQYGTWWYGRSGWCPGKEVKLTMTDITDQVLKGEDNVFDYWGLYNGLPHPGGPSIVMTSWLVVSK